MYRSQAREEEIESKRERGRKSESVRERGRKREKEGGGEGE